MNTNEEKLYSYLKQRSKWASDWPIAKLVGSATYAQLHDNAPGIFEPFPDWRSKGNSSSSIKTFFNERQLGVLWNKRPGMPTQKYKGLCKFKNNGIICDKHGIGNTGICDFVEDKVPGPPNLVSTVILEGEISILELKCLLIDAINTGKVDPRIEPLIRSSTSYNNPELTPGEILFNSILITSIILLLITFLFKING